MAKKGLLCLSLTESTIRRNIELTEKYRGKIDIVELRADFLKESEYKYIDKFPKEISVPAVLTLRNRNDGGLFTGSDNERRFILMAGLKAPYSYIDLEHDNYDTELEKAAKASCVTVIRSVHDYSGVSESVSGLINNLARNPGEIPKAAFFPKTTQELLRLMSAYGSLENKPAILLGMGDYGIPTRLLAGKLGSFLSYTSEKKDSAAPGHISIEDMTELYRYREINKDTAVYGVVGNPVMHSSSPLIHNQGFKELGLNAVYIPFLADDIGEFMKLSRLLDIKGLSVTIPHKETVIPFLSGVDNIVSSVGACNTVFLKNGGYYGTNTDAEGFLAPLKQIFHGVVPKGLRATVIGAGGAARSAVYSLKRNNIDVLILNRTEGRAEKLGTEFGCEWRSITQNDTEQSIKKMSEYNDIIVQATRVGMAPDISGDPLPGYEFSGNEIVYDMVYKPRETVFLRRAFKAGCRIVHGIDMLIEQAKFQFKIFTSRDFPFSDFSL